MHDLEKIEHDSTVETSLLNIKKPNNSNDVEQFKAVDVLSQKIDVMTVFE